MGAPNLFLAPTPSNLVTPLVSCKSTPEWRTALQGVTRGERGQARNQGGHLPPPKFSNHCIGIFTFAEILKNIMKFFILIIFKKSYWNFSLSYW